MFGAKYPANLNTLQVSQFLTLWLLILLLISSTANLLKLVFKPYNTHDVELNDFLQQRNDGSYEPSDLFTGLAQIVFCFLIICSLLVVSSLQEKPNLKTSFNTHQSLPAYRLLTAPTFHFNYLKLQVNDLQVIYTGDGPATSSPAATFPLKFSSV